MSRVLPRLLRYDLDAVGIAAATKDLIAKSKSIQDAVAAIPQGAHTFANTIEPIAEDERMMEQLCTNVTFPAYVSPDKAIREACSQSEKELNEFNIASGMREDVFKSVSAFVESEHGPLDEVDQRLVDRIMRDFKRNGLHLEQSVRDKLQENKTKEANLAVDYNQALNEDTTALKFTKAQLDGMPEDWLGGLNKVGDLYTVTTKYPDRLPLMDKCSVEATRHAMDIANGQRCVQGNTALLEECLRLRAEAAALLGYKTHADFRLETRMAKTSENVDKFLGDMRSRMKPFAQKELAVLEELKAKDIEKRGLPGSKTINSWDFRFYDRILRESLGMDEDVIKQYFPFEQVTARMMKMYESIFGLRFEPEPAAAKWHDDVQCYAVHDAETSKHIAHFYLDLFPRDGKYPHAAAFTLQSGCQPSGQAARQLPVAAMVANFSKPTPTTPSLLQHSEVETLFHEFGHIMHQCLTEAKWSRFAGTSVERDFVEAPSQMLENWVYEPKALKELSSHYETGDPLPDKIIDAIIKARNVNIGLLTCRQLFFGVFDYTIHTQPDSDTKAVFAKLRKEISLLDEPAETNGAAQFGHLLGGYDASYYGYLWAEVFAADLYVNGFKDKGDVGKRYRKMILAPGGEKDADLMMREFLGRDPTLDAFLEVAGLK